ncbi:hypothetical protein DP939_20190 [Spongiactinospora rosea]|uniref:Cobalamin biosynthesis protein CbiX n=1 Tax=Spongiactinospora rosea TaxID=2248750 RepID=A0A366LXE2_9ACTN|nr:hypothetical protein [Spongiactinospora rosea]RBQ18213.1 hypothetical protein DP939_20190 [Spongiactinospora rosea]
MRAPYRADPVTRRVVLAGGHESGYGRALGGLEPEAVAPGRELSAVLATPTPVAVVPMTLGRDPDLVRDAAQTLAWARRGRRGGELLLTDPLCEVPELVSLLLAAARGNAAKGRAALLVAPAASAEADAELFRVARLVRDGADMVEVALLGGDPDLAEGVDRCLRLGAESVAVLPAAFVRPPIPDDPRIVDAGPLLGPAAMVRLVRERVTAAEDRFTRYEEDGITTVLTARDHDDRERADHHAG